ncbi:adenylate/guanylate cyclase domain-containing protein [Candidatus Latescibacterota bacterium]
MPNIEKRKAVIIFADIIDSSKYSSVLGYEEYVRRIIDFQDIFKTIVKKYFTKVSNKKKYCFYDSRGDEGIIFILSTDNDAREEINKSIKFAFDIKGAMKYRNEINAPHEMKIAFGIHYGYIGAVLNSKKIIKRIEGYAINYAKRVETSSRIGMFSNVFVSKEAAAFLSLNPIIFYRHIADMKGLNDREEVFEVQSGFFHEFPVKVDVDEIDSIFLNDSYKLDIVHEPWIKSYIISVLHTISEKNNDDKSKVLELLNKLTWYNINEDDPIVLFYRAHLCYSDKNPRCIWYFEQIIDNFPCFVHAKIMYVRSVISFNSDESRHITRARNIAEEIIDKYSSILNKDEKTEFDTFMKNKYD